MRTLVCLQKSISRVHPKGISVRIRAEDTTGLYLEGLRMSVPMKRYIADLRNMAILLSEGDGFITVLTEEEMGGLRHAEHRGEALSSVPASMGRG